MNMRHERKKYQMSRSDNIILIGMPGAGKSTLGVILAKVMGYHFIDADIEIQRRYGKLLKDLIEDEGVEGFLKIEDDVNSDINIERAVIATGGSAVYGKNAMEHYKSTGKIVYLKLEYNELLKRLGDIKNRGVVLKENQTLVDLYHERTVLYEKYADIIIDETGLDIEQTLEKLVNEL